MIKAHTKKGTDVYLHIIKDCEYNKNGYYIEIYLNENDDRYDDFCIHETDCDCKNMNEVENFAKNFILNITDY